MGLSVQFQSGQMLNLFECLPCSVWTIQEHLHLSDWSLQESAECLINS